MNENSENQSFNPYQPPKAAVEDPLESHEIEPASKGLRFGTYVVDFIGFYAFAFLAGFVLTVVLGDGALAFFQAVPELLLGVIFVSVYYIVFESLWGRTPGKFLFRTIVVNEDGGTPTLRHVLIRTLCRFIPFEPFSVLFGERGWHDSISKTYVVPVRR